MKTRLVLTAFLTCLTFGSFSTAQIVLEPSSSGTITFVFSGFYYPNSPIIRVGGWESASDSSIFHGMIEFNLTQVDFPSIMTANNFTAKLFNLSPTTAHGNGKMYINLFNMDDSCEDDIVDPDDAWCSEGNKIDTSIFDFTNQIPAKFSRIDVTNQLRHDLFGGSPNGSSTGFVLSATNNGTVRFNHSAPRIGIRIQGWDAGHDASIEASEDIDIDVDIDIDGDTDTDTDSDSDTDTDNDIDADADSDSDMDADADSGGDTDTDSDTDSDTDDIGLDASLNLDSGQNPQESNTGNCGCRITGQEKPDAAYLIIKYLFSL